MTDGLRRRHSFSCTPELLVRDLRVSDRGVRLWSLLDRYAGGGPTTMPTRAMLALDLGCSLRSIDYALGELIEHGWLIRTSGREYGRASMYELVENPEERCATDCAPLRNRLRTPAQQVAHPDRSDQGKRSPESKRVENPPNPPTGVGGNGDHHGQHKRCRACGTAGRPDCDPLSPGRLSERCRAGDARNCAADWCECPHHPRRPS